MDITTFDHENVVVELAKSSRSECRTCSKKIEKDELRLGHAIYFDPDEEFNNKRYFHLKCFQIPPRIKNLTLNDIEGIHEIDPEDQEKILAHLKIDRGQKRKIPQKSNKESSEKKEESLYSRPLDLTKCKGYTAAEFKRVVEIKEDMESKKNDELIKILKFNGRPSSGPKSVLAMKIADQTVLGSIPNCPSCGGPFLRWDFFEGTYSCKGYLDDLDFIKCGKTFQKGDVTRHPWKYEGGINPSTKSSASISIPPPSLKASIVHTTPVLPVKSDTKSSAKAKNAPARKASPAKKRAASTQSPKDAKIVADTTVTKKSVRNTRKK